MKIHPVAEMFPMMDEDELNELAADIKQNGLLNPIILDENDQLIDGRNRLEACQRIGKQAQIQHIRLDGIDPTAYILSANEHRRHMTKGQRAMVAAKILFLKNKKQEDIATETGAARPSIAKAVVVLEYARDLAPEVISGAKGLNEAYAEAQKRKEDQQSDQAKLARLRESASDLADQVVEEKLTLAEATAALNAREQERREKEAQEREAKVRATRLFAGAVALFDPRAMSVQEAASDFLEMLDASLSEEPLSKSRIMSAFAVFKQIATNWKDQKDV